DQNLSDRRRVLPICPSDRLGLDYGLILPIFSNEVQRSHRCGASPAILIGLFSIPVGTLDHDPKAICSLEQSPLLDRGVDGSWSIFTAANRCVHGYPECCSQVLDERLDQHASGVYRQNNNILSTSRQLIPF